MTANPSASCPVQRISAPAPFLRLVFNNGIAVCLLTALTASGAELARPFAKPERIRYDGHCLTVNGQDAFIYSGAFHYFRCPKPLWQDRFQKIRDAGFNTVETYAAWNWHEPQMPAGLKDFSKADLTDLDDWLKMAEKFGLYTIVRPGPYICAEWDSGGFPQWLMTKKPAAPTRGESWLRSDDPTFLAWCIHWYDAVCPVIARHQITAKAPGQPGVILVQLENEYDYARFSDAVKRTQVRALAEAARANGIEVPLFTCWTRPVRGQSDPLLRQVFDSCNFYPRWDVGGIPRDIARLRREQPDAPLMTTELQGGWFSNVGGKLSEDQDGLTGAQINNLTLLAIQHGETLLNYYMLFGGSNPGDRAARDITTTYDYAAPIREWGGVGDRYQRVWALGHMLREHGARLARAEVVECEVTLPQKDVSAVLRRAADGSRYLFVRTSQHAEPREGAGRIKEKTGEAPEISFHYMLEPFGAAVLYLPSGVTDAERGEWLPKAAPAIERPNDLPAGEPIGSARRHSDPGPSHWTLMQPGQSLQQAGVFDSRFVFYQAKTHNATETNLLVEHRAGDTVLATISGKPARRISGAQGKSVFALPAGSSKVLLLYENRGYPNGGAGMEQPAGIFAARLTSSGALDGKPITGWRMHEVNDTSRRPEVNPEFKDDDWKAVAVDKLEADSLPSGRIAVYRAGLELSADELRRGKMELNFERIDDLGWVYVNGKQVGETTDWARSYSFEVTPQLHAGHNVIAVIVRNNEGAGGLGMPSLGRESQGTTVTLESLGSPAGLEEGWQEPAFNDKRWETVKLGAEPASSQGEALLTWYRLDFKLPSSKSGVWVPWRLRLNATGNGFLYLNGHGLGRYWQAGPQHNFFLPECWLNCGAGKSNVLTLSLHPVDQSVAIQAAVVEPYTEFAEKRSR